MMDNLNLDKSSIDSFINNKIENIKKDRDIYTTSSKIMAPLRMEFTPRDLLVLRNFFKAFIYRYFSIFKLNILMPNVGKDKLSPSEAHDVTYAFDLNELSSVLVKSTFNPSDDYNNIRQDYYNILKKYSFINLLLIFFFNKIVNIKMYETSELNKIDYTSNNFIGILIYTKKYKCCLYTCNNTQQFYNYTLGIFLNIDWKEILKNNDLYIDENGFLIDDYRLYIGTGDVEKVSLVIVLSTLTNTHICISNKDGNFSSLKKCMNT
jgi:hypothetical protein